MGFPNDVVDLRTPNYKQMKNIAVLVDLFCAKGLMAMQSGFQIHDSYENPVKELKITELSIHYQFRYQ